MKTFHNPILKGFNPDPSIIRVGEDYYIATSTFEWFPGVQIHHSKDLVHWQLVARPLNRLDQLDMKGNPDSCGVWAPCLSYDNGTFYLLYSNVRSFDGVWKDSPNYLVTTNDILGDWSKPVFLDASGFDASLFHDENGRKWYLSMLTDQRKARLFGGIILQEYDAEAQCLIGAKCLIFKGTHLGITEAPHLYKRNGYYYLMTAEGGTGYHHAISFARSKNIEGPYEIHPENPLISSKSSPTHPLQKCGHGDLVVTTNGDWYCVFLASRPLTQRGRCTLGRETAMEAMEWRDDDWIYSKAGKLARLTLPKPKLLSHPFKTPDNRDDFDHFDLNIHFQSLRVPVDNSWLTLTARKGFLRLKGRESLASLHQQSLIARRVQDFRFSASTCIEFEPQSFQHIAGLICYYNTTHYHYLHLLGDETGTRKFLNVSTCDNQKTSELAQYIELTAVKRIYLKVEVHCAKLQFYYGINENEWKTIGSPLDASILSDDYVSAGGQQYRAAFTGMFVGLCCQDLTGHGFSADFDWFEYVSL